MQKRFDKTYLVLFAVAAVGHDCFLLYEAGESTQRLDRCSAGHLR
jgi:hypothetical protein